ncbi:MAG: hypothetical protein M0R03_14725 [Novosphingobium sp.]|nr:hypothetical protein [Novosphingobium sp.]
MMAIFIAPPAHPQCGTRIFCYFMGLTTFGQIASLAAIPLIVLGFSILDQARK